MTYDAFETSQEGGRPVELYEFRLGSEVFRFTSNESDVVFQAATYEAIPIRRGELGAATASGDDKLLLYVPASLSFIQKYVLSVPGRAATLSMRQYHRDDPDLQPATLFQGTIRTVGFTKNGREAEVRVEPILSSRSRTIPRHTYQGLCNHMLYDARCKILETNPAFEKFLAVTVVSGNTITVPGAGAFGADFFESGFVDFQQDFRLVTKQTTDVLTLLLPFASSPLGQTVRCLAGCKHRLVDDCLNKFNNTINYGGFPYVPLKNPFATGLD